jgi:hypothetical protein
MIANLDAPKNTIMIFLFYHIERAIEIGEENNGLCLSALRYADRHMKPPMEAPQT